MNFPDISPIAFEIGPLVIRWYALAYVAGILLASRVICWLDDRSAQPLLSAKARDDLIFYGVLGIILGGRLGYVLFYNFDYYRVNLGEVLYLWQGGMSFHGGLCGTLLAFALFSRRYGIAWLALMDRIAVAAPMGIFFGRIANFINGELYGRVTSVHGACCFQTVVLPRATPANSMKQRLRACCLAWCCGCWRRAQQHCSA